LNNYWLLLPNVAFGLFGLAMALVADKNWRELKEARLENTNLHAQIADRNEALQEAKAEIKALQMNTVEVQEVAPLPARDTKGRFVPRAKKVASE
jgi:hypothetical protein